LLHLFTKTTQGKKLLVDYSQNHVAFQKYIWTLCDRMHPKRRQWKQSRKLEGKKSKKNVLGEFAIH
jgi:hypothetical protein